MDTFCVLPWYSREISGKKHVACCLLPDNHNIELIKIDLLNGVRNTSCSKCWDIEDIGNTSRRQQENIFLDYKLDRDLSRIKADCETNNHNINMYQIMTSNLCNQACVSCSSTFSSKWADIDRKIGNVPIKSFTLNVDSLNIDFRTAKRITLLGGEPLFDPTSFTILQKLVDADNTSCFVSLVTNGSITLSKPQLDLLSKFSDLNICISIDGIESRFEYMRWPAKWPVLLKNLETYRKIAKTISISYTISALNAIYYNETVEWFNNNNLNYNHNVVAGPAWLALKNMSDSIRQILQDNTFFKKYVYSDNKGISLTEFSKHIQLQDQVKKIHIKNYLTEIWKLIKLHTDIEY